MSTLSKKVLVLNSSWVAIRLATVRNALTTCFSTYKNGDPKATIIEAIDPATKFQSYTWQEWSELKAQIGEEGIITANKLVRLPKVIKLTKYNKVKNKKVKFSRHAIHKRDNGLCQYCGRKAGIDWTIDHVLARSKGGLTTWTNIVLCCHKCNVRKGDRSLVQCGMYLMKEPEVPTSGFFAYDFKQELCWKDFISEQYWHVELENDNIYNT
jgi:hypothetical protein